MLGFDDDNEELEYLFKTWSDEAQDMASKKAKYDVFIAKLEAAKSPFRAQENDLLARKREKDRDATLSPEELSFIWSPFRDIRRRIEHDVYGPRL